LGSKKRDDNNPMVSTSSPRLFSPHNKQRRKTRLLDTVDARPTQVEIRKFRNDPVGPAFYVMEACDSIIA
jgi:hypothetical protein